MSSYYQEQQKMIAHFKTYWMGKILDGQIITVDMVNYDVMQRFACSTKPLMQFIMMHPTLTIIDNKILVKDDLSVIK